MRYHIGPKIWTSLVYNIFYIGGWVVHSVDANQKPHVLHHLIWVGLHCLLRPVCPNTWGYYSMYKMDNDSYLLGCKFQQ